MIRTTEMNKVTEFQQNGFITLENIYTKEEINQILALIESVESDKPTFRKSADVFAIRQFIKELPEIKDLIFNEKLKATIKEFGGNEYFVIKSIYFDKPETSNWFVSYHQDLTISVDKKQEIKNFTSWTTKHNQSAVQPPLDILQNIFTIRIHLDKTDENNGALKVIPASHRKGFYRPENINWDEENETVCNVEQGGVMLMKPLLLHSSSRTTNNKRRRVVHIEFSDIDLPENLNWAEKELVELG
ncbi:phytanoyl-CoA dioxygenase [Emticicia aquatilis]|uniref:Phytanoyl-CoA dioxygenase n=2 Tax=Emticicia aquatilis TaxID=1537369 RepID=A0A916Z602_9BACT|nr:phytanoyl-CoA dioxygenase [Emticicia aquatilis]